MMTLQAPDFKYIFHLDNDEFQLTESMTIGRHLDNDVVVAGEDVLDFHLRIEPTDRGPRVHPLGEATLALNGENRAEPLGLICGDCLAVGQNEIRLVAEPQCPPRAAEWWIHADRDNANYKVSTVLNVGRAEDNEIMLIDDHISRYHARFLLAGGAVWLQDLNSANGTYLNGEPVAGGRRLFHGDEISFDMIGFQLLGKGGELTDVRRQERAAERAPLKAQPASHVDTTEIAPIEDDLAPLLIPASAETGAFLLGASEPIAGMTYRTRIGRTTVGRDDSCDVVINDRTVSSRHAEIVVRPESCTVTNLMATNGTRINGEPIQSAELKDGDVLRIGRVQLVYKDVPVAESERVWLHRVQWILLGASLLLAFSLILLLL